jgi:hypothetical protein
MEQYGGHGYSWIYARRRAQPSTTTMPSFPTSLPSLPPADAGAQYLRPGEAGTAQAQAGVTQVATTNRHGISKAVLRMGNLPDELIADVGVYLQDPRDLLALSLTGSVQRAALDAQMRTIRADALIPNIASPEQYAAARAAVRRVREPLRAERIAALTNKIQHSGDQPVAAFQHLATDLEELSPPHRTDAFAGLTDLLRLMSVGHIPLERDQRRGHAVLLKLAQEMPPALQREALGYLSQAWLPPDCVKQARDALAALAPADG